MDEDNEHARAELELGSSESEVEAASTTRRRGQWTKIWRSTASDQALDTFRQTLPTHSIDKSNQVGCTIDHLFDRDYDLARCAHKMRSQIVLCRSQRCKSQLGTNSDDEESNSQPKCPCRYKFKICLSSGAREVFQQDRHVLNREDPPTPVKRSLTSGMKEYIVASLSAGEKTTATKLFSTISAMVHAHDMVGPAPHEQQVVDFVKNWRRDNPTNSMAPMIELCDGNLYEQLDLDTVPDRDMIILCDVQPDTRPGATGTVPHLGDGSTACPLRVGMTCVQLIRDYIAVQSRSDCTTIFHIDSTHSMVINGYVVFAFGYSDCTGHFFLLAYFCTSQKRAIDIGWCIRYINRVCVDLCGVQFSPMFIMMDADKAQYNACATELPHAVVLMCWFHVTKNVWAQAQLKKVSVEDTREIFKELYDMHFASEQDFAVVKARVLSRWGSLQRGSRLRSLTDHIAKIWVNSRRFGRWQAFYTPSGYAATNNPLEQYHRKVKLQCPDGPSVPSELVKNLDASRLAFLNSDAQFSTVPVASERLLKLFRFMYKHGYLEAHRIPPMRDVPADLYRVVQLNFQLRPTEMRTLKHSIKSTNARRMQTEGMPVGGWIVDTRRRACSCAYNNKHGMCCHVVCACVQGGVHCPGVTSAGRQFVRPNHARRHVVDGSHLTTATSDGAASPEETRASLSEHSESSAESESDGAASPAVDALVDAVLNTATGSGHHVPHGTAEGVQLGISTSPIARLSNARPHLAPFEGSRSPASSACSPTETVLLEDEPRSPLPSPAPSSYPSRPRRSSRARQPTRRAVESRQQASKRSRRA